VNSTSIQAPGNNASSSCDGAVASAPCIVWLPAAVDRPGCVMTDIEGGAIPYNSSRALHLRPRPEGRESRLFFDFLGRESTPEAKKGEKGPRVGSSGREFASTVKLVQCKTTLGSGGEERCKRSWAWFLECVLSPQCCGMVSREAYCRSRVPGPQPFATRRLLLPLPTLALQ